MSKVEIDETAYWAVETEVLLNRLGTSAHGLSGAVAWNRLNQSQRFRSKRVPAWKLLLDQFNSPIMWLLFVSAVMSLTLIDDITNGVIILVILLASGLLGFWQEWSAADAVAQLLGMIETKTTVVRDGQEKEVPLDSVVVGDIVRLRAGDVIPGDCRLLSSRDLFVNESVLTGESFPAEKTAGNLPIATSITKRSNSLFLGTHVVSGIATAVIAVTGRETEFGKISDRLEHKAPETGFERGIRHFGELLIKIVLVITLVVFVVKVGFQNRPVVDSLLVGLALAVGMTPQLLPAITSVVLAAGAKAMSRHQVIVKQLLAIENLGSMTILCSDKTGTLTEGIIQLHDAVNVAGQPSNNVLRHAYWNAKLQSGFANPIDRAIQEHQAFDLAGIEKLDEVPYDFNRKRLTVLINEAGTQVMITKGALANVLEVCLSCVSERGETQPLDLHRADIEQRFRDWSRLGYRVLGLAIREIDALTINAADEQGMVFQGFLVFADPPKVDAQATLEKLRELGIQLKVITGDNRAVAETISKRVGLKNPVIMTGGELSQLGKDELHQRVHDVTIFAEVEPNQKERIILALKHNSHVVGYLGDGINDASALHAADVGISVASAVDVAREAAQVVLLRQDLGVLVEGVREGRKTFANTLKYVFFAIAANFGYMFSLAVSSLFLPFEPLLPHQILLVNLLADFPAMALATDSVDPEQIQKPRRWDIRFILRFMMSFGFTSSLFDFMTLGAILCVFGIEHPEMFNTGWFVESTLTGLAILLVIRTQRPFFRSRPGWLFVLTCLLIALVATFLPYSWLAKPLGFVTPPPALMTIVIVVSCLYTLGMELVKRLFQQFLLERESHRPITG